MYNGGHQDDELPIYFFHQNKEPASEEFQAFLRTDVPGNLNRFYPEEIPGYGDWMQRNYRREHEDRLLRLREQQLDQENEEQQEEEQTVQDASDPGADPASSTPRGPAADPAANLPAADPAADPASSTPQGPAADPAAAHADADADPAADPRRSSKSRGRSRSPSERVPRSRSRTRSPNLDYRSSSMQLRPRGGLRAESAAEEESRRALDLIAGQEFSSYTVIAAKSPALEIYAPPSGTMYRGDSYDLFDGKTMVVWPDGTRLVVESITQDSAITVVVPLTAFEVRDFFKIGTSFVKEFVLSRLK